MGSQLEVDNQGIRMNDLDVLLTLVENPTRRQILQRIAEEPSYPLQLSKELRISTQAVLKNLALMERYGVVQRTDVKSDMGPSRAVYRPSTEFTLVVDMRTRMFSARIVRSEDPGEIPDGNMKQRITEIEERIRELDRERSRLISVRNSMLQASKGEDGLVQTNKTEVS